MQNSLSLPAAQGFSEGQLGYIEMRIATHLQHATDELLGVGMCLIEAKELVPHGEWNQWVQEHVGFGERQCQYLMQVAREVPQGSLLAGLPFSKVKAVLSLPEPQREDMAKRIEEESLTVKQLREEVREAKRLAEDEAKKAGSMRGRIVEAESKLMEAQSSARAYQEAQRKSEARFADMEHLLRADRKALDDARARLLEMEEGTASVGISAEAQEQLDSMKANVQRLQSRLEDQAAKRQAAQQELLQLQGQIARGEAGADSGSGLTLDALTEAVRTFVGRVGMLPHMGAQLTRLSLKERDDLESCINMVANWVDGSRNAMNVYGEEEGIIHE